MDRLDYVITTGRVRAKKDRKQHFPNENDEPICEKKNSVSTANKSGWLRTPIEDISVLNLCQFCVNLMYRERHPEKECPLCGEPIKQLPAHLRNGCKGRSEAAQSPLPEQRGNRRAVPTEFG